MSVPPAYRHTFSPYNLHFPTTQVALGWQITNESIHGSLLVLGELLLHTGEFLLARYREVVDTVLRYR